MPPTFPFALPWPSPGGPIGDPVIEGVLNLLVAGAALNEQFDALHSRFGLNSSAFNVLRLLRGRPDGHLRRGIAQRMANRALDVTRLIDLRNTVLRGAT